jgi:hypothetical protein
MFEFEVVTHGIISQQFYEDLYAHFLLIKCVQTDVTGEALGIITLHDFGRHVDAIYCKKLKCMSGVVIYCITSIQNFMEILIITI